MSNQDGRDAPARTNQDGEFGLLYFDLVTGEKRPYLSVVATTRNDDHGGDALARTQIFLDALAAQCERHALDAELVLVEWNPPADRPGLRDALRWPKPGDHFEARIVEVPESIHNRLENSDKLPLFQMIAKNVGIRRARGDFVLATNIDLIFSDGLMEFLAERSLDPEIVYVTDRYDVADDIPEAPIDDQLRWCEQHLVRIHRRQGTYEFGTGRFYRIHEDVMSPWWLASSLRLIRDTGRMARRVARPTRRTASGVTTTRDRPAVSRRFPESIPQAVRRSWFIERALMGLHTNACGDFTLLSREGWFATGGYAELPLYPGFIDALLMYEAHYAGYDELALPHRVYHLDHSGGFPPDQDGLDELTVRLERRGIPQMSSEQFLDLVIEMYRTKKNVLEPSPDWGFSGEPLREYLVVREEGSPRSIEVNA